jgi:glycerol-1-phosphate dehydrogenase [NAD(P)+]
MENLGGPILPNELGISESLVNDSLKQAHHLRDRYTVLKFLNEVLKTEYDFVAKA